MPTSNSFYAKLATAWSNSDSLLCIGLDPLPDRLPSPVSSDLQGVEAFCRAIIDATAPYVCAYKPQAAHFAALGAENLLAELIAYIQRAYPDVVVLLDAKRGDIGSTAERYAVEAFVRYGADAVTVSPYLGEEAIQPYFEYPDRGLFVLCRTSNPGSAWMQEQGEPDPMFVQVARQVNAWNEHHNMGLVTGATYPQELSVVRGVAPHLPLLVPGIGAQGGDVAKVIAAGATADGRGLLISASRSVLYAGSGDDYAEAAALEARRLRDEIRSAVKGINS